MDQKKVKQRAVNITVHGKCCKPDSANHKVPGASVCLRAYKWARGITHQGKVAAEPGRRQLLAEPFRRASCLERITGESAAGSNQTDSIVRGAEWKWVEKTELTWLESVHLNTDWANNMFVREWKIERPA